MDEIQPLEYLNGGWIGEEKIEASKWGSGGIATVRIESKFPWGKNILIQDYSAMRDGKLWLQAHSVFCHNPEKDSFELFWFDSLGFVPATPAIGNYENRKLSFVRISPRGQTRHIYTILEKGAFEMKLESSFDQGGSWIPIMEGAYHREESR